MISYLELLELVRNGKEPKTIKLHLNCGIRIYKASYDCGEFSFYELDGKEDENFNYYLANTLLESQMIEQIIEVIEVIEVVEEPNKITKLSWQQVGYQTCMGEERELKEVVLDFNKQNDKMGKKINEMIKKINNLKAKEK